MGKRKEMSKKGKQNLSLMGMGFSVLLAVLGLPVIGLLLFIICAYVFSNEGGLK